MSTGIMEKTGTEQDGGTHGPSGPPQTAERGGDWDDANNRTYIDEGLREAEVVANTQATRKVGGVALTVVSYDRVIPDGNRLHQLLGRRRAVGPFGGTVVVRKLSPLPQHN